MGLVFDFNLRVASAGHRWDEAGEGWPAVEEDRHIDNDPAEATLREEQVVAVRIPMPGPISAAGRMLAGTVLTGVCAGVLGALLTLALHLVQHLAFGYTENTFLVGVERASPVRRIIALSVGGVLAGLSWWLHRRKVPIEKVSVTHALRASAPDLPFVPTVVDALIQILAVGAGASLGREGAPRQAGAASAGWIAKRLGLTVAQRRTLMACGAGAGLAAVYNVPLGGAAFTLEILLVSVSLGDVVPALLTASIAAAVAWPILSNRSTYQVSAVHLSGQLIVWSVLLGPIAGLVGVLFTRLTSTARIHAATGWRTAVAVPAAFTAVGSASITLPTLLGNGKGPAGLAFDGTLSLGLASMLVIFKPAATALCLASGAIGGLLTPAVATGAALGTLLGGLWSIAWPGGSPSGYAVIGAAVLLAVTQRAPITAILLTLEFVGTGQTLLVPIMIGVALAIGTSTALARLAQPGITSTEGGQPVLKGDARRVPRSLLRRSV